VLTQRRIRCSRDVSNELRALFPTDLCGATRARTWCQLTEGASLPPPQQSRSMDAEGARDLTNGIASVQASEGTCTEVARAGLLHRSSLPVMHVFRKPLSTYSSESGIVGLFK
jgi:hypothetical protein